MKEVWRAVAAAMEAGQSVILGTVVQGPQSGAMGLYDMERRIIAGAEIGLPQQSGLINTGEGQLFVETLFPRPVLVIFGGGHLAVPVAKIAKLVDFAVIVNDDRPEFACRERFPEADQVLAMSHQEAFAQLQLNSRHYLVIVTRGHVQDRDCLIRALATDASYIGVIGSKKKATEVNQWLVEKGYSQEDIQRIFSPIGLAINAQTPEEIAVSIMAEVIRERSRRPGTANLGAIAAALTNKPQGETWALVTIVDSFGSTPRGPGSRMLVKPNGTSIGTVGGGPGEKEAETIAQAVIKSRIPRLAEFHLDNTLAAEQGGVCGGNMTMFIQPV